ncbi:hypothetical protein M2162_000478 [Streptomyces sp. SAI-041]|nr:hypothetical protein [Streptomyces sp. SAI-041]
MVALDQLVCATALQTIHQDLGASMTSLERTVNAFSLSFAALMIPGLVVFASASAARALATNIGLLIAGRVLQGVGRHVDPEDPLPGQTLRDGAADERAAHDGETHHGSVDAHDSAALVRRRGRGQERQSRRRDPNILLVAASMFPLGWALVRSGPAGWAGGEVLGSLAGGLVLLAGFVGWERRATEPTHGLRPDIPA